MAKTKTNYTTADVHEFINSFADTDQKRQDSFELLKIMQDITGCEPKMWGPSIIGFLAIIIINTKADTRAMHPFSDSLQENPHFHSMCIPIPKKVNQR